MIVRRKALVVSGVIVMVAACLLAIALIGVVRRRSGPSCEPGFYDRGVLVPGCAEAGVIIYPPHPGYSTPEPGVVIYPPYPGYSTSSWTPPPTPTIGPPAAATPGPVSFGQEASNGAYVDATWLLDASHGWLAEGEGYIFATNDLGTNWRQQYQGNVWLHAIQCGTVQSCVAMGNPQGCSSACETVVLATTDGGEHWQETYRGALGQSQELSVAGKSAWITFASCDRSEDQRDCPTGLIFSWDAGVTWLQSQLPFTLRGRISRPTTLDAFAISPSAGDVASNLLVTHDGGAHWASLSLPQGADSLYFSSPGEGWLVATSPGNWAAGVALFHTVDGGASWTKTAWSPIWAYEEGTAPRGGLGDAVRRSMGGGEPEPPVLAFANGKEVWMNELWGVQRSLDSGMTWETVARGEGGVCSPIAEITAAGAGWIRCASFDLLVTSDGGNSWKPAALPPARDLRR